MLAATVKFVKNVVIVLCCIAAVVLGALFAFENPDKITPVFWGLQFPPLSLGYYLIFIFVLGLLLGASIILLSKQTQIMGVKKENKKLSRQVRALASTENDA